MKVNEKVFVVTGAGGGIGSALALTLLEKGARVAAVDLQKDSLNALHKKADMSKKLSLHPLDITHKKSASELVKKVANAHDAIDALINCAGIIQPFVKVQDMSEKDIQRVMNVNFYGTLYMTQAFLPTLCTRPEAHLVNISSMGGFLPVPGQGVYGASKAAVKLLTEALYAELLTTNVRVSIVFPGATNTNITTNSNVRMPKLAQNKKQANVPMLSAEEAARAIIRGIERNKPQIFTGKDSKLMNTLYRISPTLATKFIARQMKDLLDTAN